jgi:tetratricopeptide (TPR) repeat protein
MAAWRAGRILFKNQQFIQAAAYFETAVSLFYDGEVSKTENASLHFDLGLAHHYSGNSRKALEYVEAAGRLCEQFLQPRAGCLRFLAEIQNALGEHDAALISCETALSLRLLEGTRWLSVADALFWKGYTLLRLDRKIEASACIEEALSIWQEYNDDTGIGHCLRLLGRLRLEEGRVAEACAHLDYAIELHTRTGDLSSKASALIAKGDALAASRRWGNAKAAYEEALSYYSDRANLSSVEEIQAKINLLG